MNINPNQIIFEEFQRSVDIARNLAQKLGPEHFYLAYDRCAKLQKVIFKRACGYNFSFGDSNGSNEYGSYKKEADQSINQKSVPTNSPYLNLPSFLCGSNFPLLISSGQSASNSHLDIGPKRLVMLKQYTESTPSEEEEALLHKEGYIVNLPLLSICGNLKETVENFLKHFPESGESQFELCLPQKANPVVLVPVTEEEFSQPQSVYRHESRFFLRPVKTSNKSTKHESSMPSPPFQHSDNSTNSSRINSFMVESDKTQLSEENIISEVAEGSVFPETIFLSEISPKSNMDIAMTDDYKSRSTRRYNWSVVLSNLHENHPTQLRNESVRFPDVCHELHAIPPTPQKLRPTKRCQLCLKGYKSRKESRYYCRPCDKGFHIKCFEVYHQQLGYVQYKVKIINGER